MLRIGTKCQNIFEIILSLSHVTCSPSNALENHNIYPLFLCAPSSFPATPLNNNLNGHPTALVLTFNLYPHPCANPPALKPHLFPPSTYPNSDHRPRTHLQPPSKRLLHSLIAYTSQAPLYRESWGCRSTGRNRERQFVEDVSDGVGFLGREVWV